MEGIGWAVRVRTFGEVGQRRVNVPRVLPEIDAGVTWKVVYEDGAGGSTAKTELVIGEVLYLLLG
ncbi:hypothetical protein B8W69_16110 [Mycobacterium vulneris]|uniref:Uncharacterized protein n=1 Tax=Mycolicibacterium vulneris TaxID=547163 RepID=A0A1X2KY96_9MYCO|nr:hypothetical protein B8W69_16110 [Mycolicibacterium vulneris]